MAFKDSATGVARLNDYNLRDLPGSASFEVLTISGRGLAPSRDRELQFPGDVGARDYGGKPNVRRLEVSGILYADTMPDFRLGLDKLKELARLRLKIDEILYGEAEAQTLWFADESVIHNGTVASGPSSVWVPFDTSASSEDDYYNGMEVEITTGAGAGQVREITDYTGASRLALIAPYFAVTPSSGDGLQIRDNRYYLVNYSGTMNETRITNQWMKTGYSNITLPFKAVYPFAVSDWKKQNIASVNGGDFQAISTGNAPSYPKYEIKGGGASSVDAQIVETTQAFQSNFDKAEGTNILNSVITPSVSTGIKHQAGKLNQALEFDSSLNGDNYDSFSLEAISVRGSLGIADFYNFNQGTVAFWIRKSDWSVTTSSFDRFVAIIPSSGTGLIGSYHDNSTNYIYFLVNGTWINLDVSSLVGGEWYYVVQRWDSRRTGWSSAYSTAQLVGSIYKSDGTAFGHTTSTANISDPNTTASTFELANYNESQSFSGQFDDLAIWDRPLTDSEVTTLLNGGTGARADSVGSSDLVYYSDFDGTVGTDMVNPIASSNVDTALASATTTTVVTVNGNGDKIFKDNDRIVLYDETGYKVQGAVNGTATTTNVPIDNLAGGAVTDADKVGVYGTFNGSSLNGGDVLDIGTNDFSISCWMRTATENADTIVGKYVYPPDNGYSLYLNTGGEVWGIIAFDGTAKYFRTSTTVNDNKWHNIVFTCDRDDATGLKCYIDGVEASYTTQNDPSPLDGDDIQTSVDFTVGTGGYAFLGDIRDVAMWNGTALTAANALTLATNPITGVGTVGGGTSHWKINETSISPAVDSIASNDLTNTSVTRTQQAYISKNLIADGNMENGGIGGWSFENWTGMVSFGKTSASSGVFKDAQGFLVSGTGTDDELSVSTAGDLATGEDYVVRHYCKVTTASTNVIYWYNHGAVWPVSGWEPYQTLPTDGEWHFIEFCAETGGTGAGRLKWARGSGSSVYYVDDVKFLPNIANDGGLENWTTSTNLTDWTEQLIGSSTLHQETSSEHSGASCVRLDIDSSNSFCSFYEAVYGKYVVGDYYEVAFWAKASSTSNSPKVQGNCTIDHTSLWSWTYHHFDLTTDWKRYSYIVQAGQTDGATQFGSSDNCQSISVYIDDISIVHRPDLSPTLTAMSTNYRYEPTRLGKGYHTGGNEQMIYAITGNKDESSGRVVFRPQFPYNTGQYSNILTMSTGTADYMNLWYSASEDKFYFAKYASSVSYDATSVQQIFSANDEIEIGWYTDPTSGVQIFVNGSASGSTGNANTTSLASNPCTLVIGNSASFYNGTNVIIDDLEILTKSMPAEWFAEQYTKRLASKNQNLALKYTGTLDSGDILTIDCSSTKVITRAELYDASAGTSASAVNNTTLYSSMMPILSQNKSMLYFPNTISNGVDIHYRNNYQ